MRHSIPYSSPLISFTPPTCLACLSWFREGPYHASTTFIAQVNIKWLLPNACSCCSTFFYISRLLITDQLSITWHAQHLRLRMQRVSMPIFFSLSFLLLFTLSFFAIYSKASSLPVSLMRLHISLFRHLQFSTLVESMLRNYPHRRLIPMIMSVCNRTK